MNDGYSFYPIVKILQLVHENIQMVHRDIKSDNIILTDIMVYVWWIDWLIDWCLTFMNAKKEKKRYDGWILFVYQNILNQIRSNSNRWFIEINYEPDDDHISLLNVCMYVCMHCIVVVQELLQ